MYIVAYLYSCNKGYGELQDREEGGAVLSVGGLTVRTFIVRQEQGCWSTTTKRASNL